MEAKKIEISISGMHCQSCVTQIREKLLGCPGVSAADVEVGKASVAFDGAKCSATDLFSAVESAGDFQMTSFRKF